MAFAFNYFAQQSTADMDSLASVTYENVVVNEDYWKEEENIWVLGSRFHLPHERALFLEHIKSFLWFTYRKGYTPIGGTGPTSDSGWGCMLRCGQMLLARALAELTMDKDWKWTEDKPQPPPYKRILHQLSDERSSCYSIHQIAQMGVEEGKEVGQWFGPNTISQVLRRLSQFDQENVLAIHVAMDNTVCIEDIERLCSTTPTTQYEGACSSTCKPDRTKCNGDSPNVSPTSDDFWRPLLLLIPLRLGLSEINPVYFTHLKECLHWKESVGVIGGKPNHAYYFLGCSEDSMIFLDPHTTQPYVKLPDITSNERYDDTTFHCDTPGRMLLTNLDPSLALGFICTTRGSFCDLCHKVKQMVKTPTSFPLFEVVDRMPQCQVVESRVLAVKSHRRKDQPIDDNTCLTLDSDDSLESEDEFEILDFQ
nr:cysteine protease ATG4A isoform X1 [Ciona intestinalis]|eukprot:XP_002128504.1 cysteine protease ATG4A isoform X1 [Ciona intestinalis]